MALLKRKRSGLGDAMEVVTRFVNACNRHDADGVYSCLHPDFDSIQPMYPSRNFRGADQVFAHDDEGQAGRAGVLLRAGVDQAELRDVEGAGEEMGGGIGHQGNLGGRNRVKFDPANGLVRAVVHVGGIRPHIPLLRGVGEVPVFR